MRRLNDLCGMNGKTAQYKPLRSRQITKSENHTQQVTNVLTDRFLNPFGAEVDQEESVYNLSSGMAFNGDAEGLLAVKKKGEELYQDFRSKRLHTNEMSIHARLPRQKPTLFSSTKRKTKRKKDNSSEVIKANRNVLGKLLTLSANARQPIDFQKALTYPLYDVPLSLAFPDGTQRSNQKCMLLNIIKKTKKVEDPKQQTSRTTPAKEVTTLIVDMIAHYRVISQNLPATFRDWIEKFLRTVHNDEKYNRIDIVADTYREFSIKSGEREKRGSTTERILIKSTEGKIPRDINTFFSNNANKTRLI